MLTHGLRRFGGETTSAEHDVMKTAVANNRVISSIPGKSVSDPVN